MKKILNVSIVDEVMSEFEWPSTYELIDDLPDGIEVCFPKCTIYFSEYDEGEVQVYFLADELGTKNDLTLGHALKILRPVDPLKRKGINFIDEYSVYGTPSKVKNSLRNKLKLIHAYLLPHILGNQNWVEHYK